jgi:CDGSH-type Zn-finger protein
MSDKPAIGGCEPARVQVEEGATYLWCGCGLSKGQPWCDRSHNAPDNTFWPVKWKPPRSGVFALCVCKRTQNPPYCDGSHKTLAPEQS